MSEKDMDSVCLYQWAELFTSRSGRGHAYHICPLPYGHQEDHSCPCEWDDPRISSEKERDDLKVEVKRLTAILDYAIDHEGFSIRHYNEWKERRDEEREYRKSLAKGSP